MVTVRTVAPHWMLSPIAGCGNQLFLNLDHIRLPLARGFNRGDAARRNPSRLPPRSPAWVIRATALPAVDDPTICPPPTSPGQLELFPVRRHLTRALASRIFNREVDGLDEAISAIAAMKAEYGRGGAWSAALTRMMRLVLAAMIADEAEAMTPSDADGIDDYRGSIVEVLRRVDRWDENGRPATRGSPSPANDARRKSLPTTRWRTKKPAHQRQCAECGSWGNDYTLCGRCRWWRQGHPVGDCERCGRSGIHVGTSEFIPDDDRTLCRSCTLTLVTAWPDPVPPTGNQLFFAGPLAPAIRTQSGALGYEPPNWRTEQVIKRRREEPASAASEHRQHRGQFELFSLTRDWSGVCDDPPPALSPEDIALLEAMRTYVSEMKWSPPAIRVLLRTLRILFGWLGSDAPIHEHDVWPLNAAYDNVTAVHAVFVLEAFSMVDRDEPSTSDERWVQARIEELKPPFATEIEVWVRAMRGYGRRRRPPLQWRVIAGYLRRARSLIEFAAERYSSLSEVTADDVRRWRDENSTTPDAGNYGVAVRSIFGTLKAEKVISTDPTSRIPFRVVDHFPVGLPDDAIQGLLDRTATPMARAMVALTAIHGASRSEIVHLKIGEIDMAQARITLPKRVIYIDHVTMDALSRWFAERSTSWPMTRNDHVFITRNSAFTPEDKPISGDTLASAFRSIGTTCNALRTDRILYEAKISEDPVGLMRQFGLSVGSAMSYISAAHPEKSSTTRR
ncbi:tyrosine-type recombinase/integrase [Gordonia liuliyuniae]|uniref:Phage integrase family protein n=1 Tax=Gordonia liuliyuniae TaxID=2911517 RepID=A0ABS9IWD8_9ACTN|nr:hypothetical protein [Gordonia liuliyuniae]MCF8589868.1 hypothetical protein [Gordonia liuliyuniae]